MHARGAAVLAVALATLSLAVAARARDFVVAGDCQRLSVDPPLYRLTFYLYNAHGFNPFCRVHIAPSSYLGSTPQPIVGCSAPAPLTCSVDSSTGTAIFSADTCIYWGLFTNLSIVVRAVPAYFLDTFDTDTPDRKASHMWYPCTTVVGVPVRSGQAFELSAAGPNPFSTTTRFTLTLERSEQIDISVHDIAGRRIATLFTGEMQPGAHAFAWSGTSDDGVAMGAGTYFLRATSGSGHLVSRAMFLRR